MRVVYIVSNYDSGGASRNLAAAAQMLVCAGDCVSILALEEESIRNKPPPQGARWSDGSDLAEADVVVIQFGNRPAMHRFLRSTHPPMRVLMWLLVEGATRPHVVTPEVAAFADILVTTSSSTLALNALANRPAFYVPAFVELEHFAPRASSGTSFTVGYLGTVDFVKMHPDYVSMSAAVADEDIRFGVWGFGTAYPTLKAQAARLGQSHRFQFHGATPDPASAFAEMHIYGYPLCDETYATNDRSMQEAMAMALPSVVLDLPGLRDLTIDGVTALVARSRRDYAQGIMTLKRNPELANALGRNARDHVRRHFDPHKNMQRLHQALVDLLSFPKRDRNGTGANASLTGAGLFVASLGDFAGEFARNLASFEGGADYPAWGDEEAIANATPGLCNAGAGGVFDYRSAYPNDPILRFWSGLIFSRQGRHAVAFSEFLAAMRLGLPQKRVVDHLQSAGRQCGMSMQAIERHTSQLGLTGAI